VFSCICRTNISFFNNLERRDFVLSEDALRTQVDIQVGRRKAKLFSKLWTLISSFIRLRHLLDLLIAERRRLHATDGLPFQ